MKGLGRYMEVCLDKWRSRVGILRDRVDKWRTGWIKEGLGR